MGIFRMAKGFAVQERKRIEYTYVSWGGGAYSVNTGGYLHEGGGLLTGVWADMVCID